MAAITARPAPARHVLWITPNQRSALPVKNVVRKLKVVDLMTIALALAHRVPAQNPISVRQAAPVAVTSRDARPIMTAVVPVRLVTVMRIGMQHR